MSHRAGIPLAIATALVLAGPPVAGQAVDQSPGQSRDRSTPAGPAPDKPATPWNTGTTRPPEETPPPADSDSMLSLRVYDGMNSRSPLPYRPRQPDDPAYAVDVSAITSRCADGSIVITALLIGGQLTPLDNRCNAKPPPGRSTPTPDCDANAWTCGSTPVK